MYRGGKVRSNRGGMVRHVRDGGMTLAFARNDTTKNCSCGVGGAVNDGAVESESVRDIVRGLRGDENLGGLSTTFEIGSKSRTPLP